MSNLNMFGGKRDEGLFGAVMAVKRACPVVLAALASLTVAYGFEVHPLMQLGGSIPLSDMAPGLAQAFSQLGNVPLRALTGHAPDTRPIG